MQFSSVRICIGCVMVLCCIVANSQKEAPASDLAKEIAAASNLTDNYRVTPNIVYQKVGTYDARLDVYRRKSAGKKATLIYIHGGGWRGGPSKEEYSLWFEPFLMLGWNVVNVEYRPSTVAAAPAAVEDCLCASHWVVQHAVQYDIDLNRVVLMGHSAGGHLALMTGFAPASAGFDRGCGGISPLKPAAIIDWFGITDVADLLHSPHTQAFAQRWIGSLPNPDSRARRVSPLSYVRKGLPPTILIHGDKDPKVPYSQATELYAALEKAGVSTELVTIPGGGHGGYGNAYTQHAYERVFEFLKQNHVGIEATK